MRRSVIGSARGRLARRLAVGGAILAGLGLALPVEARADTEAPIEAPPPSDDGMEESDPYVEEIDEEPGRPFFSIGARGGVWLAKLEAELLAGAESDTDNEVRFDTDLELDEYEAIPYGEVFIRLGFFSLHGDGFRSRREGDTTLEANIRFAGIDFSAGVPVEAELEIDTLAGWFEITPFRFDSFELGFGLGVRYYRIEATIREEVTGIEATEEVEGPMPFAVVRVAVFPGPFEIYANARGLYVEYEDRKEDLDITAAYLDGEVGLALHIGSHVAVGAAYKVLYFDVEERGQAGFADEERYEVLNHGPFAWVQIRL